MTLSTTSLAQLRIIKESAFGVTPNSGNPNNLRMTGETLAFAIKKTESAEIRSDRQTADLIIIGADANGGVNAELSYMEYDDLMRAVLQASAWSYYGVQTPGVGAGVGTSFTADFTTTTITASVAPTGTSAFTTLAKGQWFKLNAPSHANHGKSFRVSGSVAPTSTVITVDAATPLATGTAVALCSVSSARITNGVTQDSYTLERALTDVTQFFAYRGMTLSKMNLKMASGAITTASFEFMGKDAVRSTSTTLPGSPVASTAYDVQNGVTGVANILEGGAALANTFVKSFDITFENTLRGREGLGTLGNVSIGSGTFKVSGTMEVYLADGTLYDKFLNNTTTSIQVVTKDSANNGYAIQIPAVKYGDAKVNAGSKDQDIMLSMPFTGIVDSSSGGSGKMAIIDRFGV